MTDAADVRAGVLEGRTTFAVATDTPLHAVVKMPTVPGEKRPVILWNPRELQRRHRGQQAMATAVTINGLCYAALVFDLGGYWLLVDRSRWYLGPRAIRWWVRDNAPRSLEQARAILAARDVPTRW